MLDESDSSRRQKPARKAPPPLDQARLNDLALGYAARFATTRAKLARYLARKLKERGWAGSQPADIAALIDRLAALGYVDDASFAAMKGRAMAARGLGQRRVAEALAAAGVTPDDRGAAPDAAQAIATAVAFARRKRLGPFARTGSDDPNLRQKALAAMLRAGHSFEVARRVLAAGSVAAAETLSDDEAV
jgi:regulatory protein